MHLFQFRDSMAHTHTHTHTQTDRQTQTHKKDPQTPGFSQLTRHSHPPSTYLFELRERGHTAKHTHTHTHAFIHSLIKLLLGLVERHMYESRHMNYADKSYKH